MATVVLMFSALLGFSTAIAAVVKGAGTLEAVAIHCASSWAFALVLALGALIQKGVLDEIVDRMRPPTE